MARRDPKSAHGFVKFPAQDPLFRNTGEGGLVVFAIWDNVANVKCCQELWAGIMGPVVTKWFCAEERADRFEKIERSLQLTKGYKFQHLPIVEKRSAPIPEEHREFFDPLYLSHVQASRYRLPHKVRAGLYYQEHYTVSGHEYRHIEGLIYLGSTGGSWCHETDGYFTPTRDDLTDEGRVLLTLLDHLYGSEAQLITVLDT